jgi:hypothetical protein
MLKSKNNYEENGNPILLKNPTQRGRSDIRNEKGIDLRQSSGFNNHGVAPVIAKTPCLKIRNKVKQVLAEMSVLRVNIIHCVEVMK